MNNITGKVTSWTLSLAVGILVAIVAVKASDSKVAPAFNIDHTPLERVEGGAVSYSSIIKKVKPSIVSISTTKVVEVRDMFGGQFSPFGADDIFRHFFGNRGYQTPQKQKRTGLGSGVIVSSDGYILTNNHVVEDGDEIRVQVVSNGQEKEYDAKIVGGDPRSDIAVLKIEETGLPAATLGNSDAVLEGDVVFAFGNPFGVGQTVTMGIISATGRNNLGIEEYENFIQTDAAINPGNSGGALTDALGRVVGINTAIYSRSGGYQGIGFAIPVNMAENIMKQIIVNGKVERGFLGVSIQPLTDDLVDEFSLEGKQGALVADVTEGSAAEKAGLQRGDVIVSVNGKEVKNASSVSLEIASLPPGEVVTIKVIRDGKEMDIQATLDARPEDDKLIASGGSSAVDNIFEGATLKNLSNDIREDMNIPEKIQGVFVAEVSMDSLVYEKGLRQGDVIIECNDQTIENIASLKKAIQIPNRNSHKLLVYSSSKNSTRYVIIKK